MNVMQFIIVDSDARMRDTRDTKTRYTYAMPGSVLLPVGSYVPVIRAGRGCLGIARVESIEIREESTTVTFTMVDKNGNYDAIYTLYKLNAGRMDEDYGDDGYDDDGSTLTKETLRNIFR